MSITLSALQKQRRDTAANWTAENPTLLAGEIGLESDTGYWKVGDGATAWTSLGYVTGTQLSAYPIVDTDIAAAAEIAVSKLADGAARQLLQTDAAGTGVEWTSNVDLPGTLDVTGAATFDGNVTIQGDLTVNGTETIINTQTLEVEDKNVILGNVTTPSDVTADGGGVTLKGTTDKTINWVDATDAWTLSEHVDLASAKEYRIAGTKVLDATSLGSAVVSSSLTSVGTIGTGVWNGTTVATGYGGTGQTTYTDGELLIGKTDGTLAKATITAGTGVTVTNGDGSITIAASGVTSVTGTSPIASTGGTTPDISIQDGTTTQKGAVQLEDSTSSTSTTTAATPNSVKSAYDLADAALPESGGTMTGALGVVAGTESAPGIFASGDTNTGFFFGTDEVSITTGGTQRATVDASGRLLVGTDTAYGQGSATPQVQSIGNNVNASIGSIRTSDNTGGPRLILTKSRGTDVASINTIVVDGDELGSIYFSGADGVDRNSLGAAISAYVDGTPGANDMPGRLVFSTTADGASSPTEAMRIDSNQIIYGKSAAPRTYYGNTDTAVRLYTAATSNTGALALESTAVTTLTRYHFSFSNPNGAVGSISTNGSATAYNTSSDYRLKENVVPLTGAADRLKQIPVHRFNFIADPDKTVDGFLAHEAQAVVPECVTGTKDEVDDDGNPVYQGIDQSKLVPLITAALQEALHQIETQAGVITALNARITALEAN